eukprot:COSAG02_NODE_146_length_33985_cov_263.461695_19_plen_74_part_00
MEAEIVVRLGAAMVVVVVGVGGCGGLRWGCRARLGRFRGLAGLERPVLGVLGGGFRVVRGPVWRRWLSREAVL